MSTVHWLPRLVKIEVAKQRKIAELIRVSARVHQKESARLGSQRSLFEDPRRFRRIT